MSSERYKELVLSDGIILPMQEARPILDAERLIVYEVVRIASGEPIFWHEHYQRFTGSLATIGKEPGLSETEFLDGIRRTSGACGITDNNLRIEQYRMPDCSEEHTMIYPIHSEYPTEDMFRLGVEVGIFKAERTNPQAKIFNKEIREASDRMIRETGAAEVLLVNRRDEITEGSRSNVFFIKDGRVISPPQHSALPGITRLKVLEIIRGHSISYSEETISTDRIGEFDAAFLTGTSKDVLPIANICGQSYDVCDPLLRSLMEWYRELAGL